MGPFLQNTLTATMIMAKAYTGHSAFNGSCSLSSHLLSCQCPCKEICGLLQAQVCCLTTLNPVVLSSARAVAKITMANLPKQRWPTSDQLAKQICRSVYHLLFCSVLTSAHLGWLSSNSGSLPTLLSITVTTSVAASCSSAIFYFFFFR